MSRRSRGQSGSSTSAVLWLMIMLVFLPIAAAHAVARHAVATEHTTTGVSESSAPKAG